MSDLNLTCQGCGKSYDRANWNLTRVEVAPATLLTVCVHSGQSSSSDRPKDSCLERAKNKVRPCPGCGAPLGERRWRRAALCDGCQHVLERHRAQGDPQPTKWVGLDGRRLFGGDRILSGEAIHAEAVRLTRALAAALGYCPGLQLHRFDYYDAKAFVPDASGSPHSSGGYGGPDTFYLELPADRAEALREFGNGLAKMGQAQYERGLARGHNVLERLIDGEITVSAYEERLPKKG